MLPPDDGSLIEQAVFLQPHGCGLQIAEIIAALAALKRHVSAGIVFKVDKADLAVVAHDDVAGKGLAQVLAAAVHLREGGEALLPIIKARGSLRCGAARCGRRYG